MRYAVEPIPSFIRRLKRLAKKYPSLLAEVETLGEQLANAPTIGASIGHNCYKVRLAIKSKGKGKSGVVRVITHVQVTATRVYLLSIYDKSEQADISDVELQELIASIPEE